MLSLPVITPLSVDHGRLLVLLGYVVLENQDLVTCQTRCEQEDRRELLADFKPRANITCKKARALVRLVLQCLNHSSPATVLAHLGYGTDSKLVPPVGTRLTISSPRAKMEIVDTRPNLTRMSVSATASVVYNSCPEDSMLFAWATALAYKPRQSTCDVLHLPA